MTKGAGDENFPVASWLLPRRMRKPVHAFYRFVRAADDVADSDILDAEERRDRLQALRTEVSSLGIGAHHANTLLDAFAQDTHTNRYATIDDVLAYCQLSAAPVGRYLIDLAGADAAAYPSSDALCAALQLLNHIQDCGDDFKTLNRVYLPEDWIAFSGATVGDLGSAACTPELRRVLDRTLDVVDGLLAQSSDIGTVISHPRLAREAAGIHALACQLASVLRYRDPLADRVRLSPLRAGIVFLVAALRRASVPRSGVRSSSFYSAMRILPRPKRDAMYALYDFCRVVDDIADGNATAPEKRDGLQAWRSDVIALYNGKATTFDGVRALKGAVGKHDLQQTDFMDLIAGMEVDATDTVRLADDAQLFDYCDKVACTVGRLSGRIFGAPRDLADTVATHLGLALQLTNILRDVAEDAARDRVYLPATLLSRHGVPCDPADAVLLHPSLPGAMKEFADVAFDHYTKAETAIIACGRSMRPARVMLEVYRRILLRMSSEKWVRPGGHSGRLRLGVVEKIWIAVRYGVL